MFLCIVCDKLHKVSFCSSHYFEAFSVKICLFETQFVFWPVMIKIFANIC
jgi:hypothetical protein